MQYISEERHMFVMPKDFKKKENKYRKAMDEDLAELKKRAVESDKPGILTVYNVEISD